MRTALILAFAAAFAATSVGCAVEGDDSTSLSRKPSSKKSSKTTSGSTDDEEEDDGDREGEVGPRTTTNEASNPNTPVDVPTTTPQAAQGFSLTVDKEKSGVDLGKDSMLNVTVTPKNGFTGTVNITVEGLPTGVTAAPASGAPGTPIAVKLTSTTSAPVSAADIPLTIKGTSGAESATVPTSFRVNNQVTMTIPTNAAALIKAGGNKVVDGWGPGGAFGPAGSAMLVPAGMQIEVKVKNEDSTPRTIHGPGGATGFAHGNGAVQPGAFEQLNGADRIRKFGPGVTTQGYLHGEPNNTGTAVGFKLTTQAAP